MVCLRQVLLDSRNWNLLSFLICNKYLIQRRFADSLIFEFAYFEDFGNLTTRRYIFRITVARNLFVKETSTFTKYRFVFLFLIRTFHIINI